METYMSEVLREGLAFGESPRWHDRRLWFSDFFRHGVYSIDGDGAEERLEHSLDTQPSGLGWNANGELFCVSMTDQRVLRFGHEGPQTFCDISEYCGFWANDLLVSASGHCYVGNFGFDLDLMIEEHGVQSLIEASLPTTNLVVIDPEGRVIQVIPEMTFPNAMVVTPDGSTLIVGETLAYRLSAFSINTDGTLSQRRVWAQLDFVATDGMCLDDEGQIWLANAATNQCLRVKEGGSVTGSVTTTQRAYACMLGGDDRRTIFIMSAPTSSRFKVADVTRGKIEVARVTTPGAGLP